MPRVYHPYTSWEDYQVGMYRLDTATDGLVELARALLCAPAALERSMRDAVRDWPTAAEHNLTAIDTNRRSWLGAAACMWLYRAPQVATRAAWWQLTDEERAAANAAADRVLADWDADRGGAGTLFELPQAVRDA